MYRPWLQRIVLVASAVVLIAATLSVARAQTSAPTTTTAPPGAQATVQQPGGTSPSPGQGSRHGPGSARMQEIFSAVAAKLGVTTDQLREAFRSAWSEHAGAASGRAGGQPGGSQQGWRGAHGMATGSAMRAGLNAAAQAIGITPEQLRQELPGKSLADVARAHNVDPNVVANALKAEASTRIDQLMTRQVPATVGNH